MRPIILNSKAAEKDLLRIKSIHGDLVTGLANQQIKVEGYRQQKAAEMQSQQTMKNDMDKEKMVQNTAVAKNNMDFQLKQSELDIKRAALSST